MDLFFFSPQDLYKSFTQWEGDDIQNLILTGSIRAVVFLNLEAKYFEWIKVFQQRWS